MAIVAILALGHPAGARSPRDGSGSLTAGSHPFIVMLRGFEAPSTTRSVLRSGAGLQLDAARVASMDRAVDRLAVRLGFHPRFEYHWALQGFAADLGATQVAALRADPGVAAVSPDVPVQLADQAVPSGVRRVRAQPVASGGPPVPDLETVNVAEIDTGIRHLAAEAELNVAGGVDCADDAGRGRTDGAAWADVDPAGHGSHVAGIIGAIDNGRGVVGVAPGVTLWSVRVFDASLQGSSSTVICGLDWVARTRTGPPANAIDVANLSLRGPRVPAGPETCTAGGTGDPDAEHVAVCAVVRAGVTLVVAAGNESTDTQDVVPAAYDQVITVSALTDFDGAAGATGTESCTGPRGDERDDTFAAYSNHGADVDLIAPGSCILSLNRSDNGTGTRVMSGTSMAAPHATGAAARYIAALVARGSARPTPAQVRSALRATAGYNWSTTTDPDATPDRLLNVAALSAAPGFAMATFPPRVTVPAGFGTDVRSVQVDLTRWGLYTGAVQLTVTAPAGIAAVPIAPVLSGLTEAGISTTIRITVQADVPDGDHALSITASSSSHPDRRATVIVHVDRERPAIGNVAAAIVPGAQLGAGVAVHVTWHGRDAGGAIARYQLQQQVAANPWKSVKLPAPTAVSADRLLALKTDYGLRVRAIDDSGNVGDWSTIWRRIGLRESDRPSIQYSSPGWTTVLHATASGGSLRTSTTIGASASLTFYGTAVAWVAPVGPGKGTATVLIDGHAFPRTVSLYSVAPGTRRIVFASGPMASDTHSLVITVAGGRVDLDAILILG
jgi:subtilisin